MDEKKKSNQLTINLTVYYILNVTFSKLEELKTLRQLSRKSPGNLSLENSPIHLPFKPKKCIHLSARHITFCDHL